VKVYIASTLHHPLILNGEIQAALRSKGHDVVSTWHDGPLEFSKGMTFAERWRIAKQNYTDLDKADMVLAVPFPDAHLRGAHTEIGYALGKGKPVLIFGDFRAFNTMATHSLVNYVEHLEDIGTRCWALR